MILNLGHTVGHAIETLSGYTISHGECVAKGIKYAINVSQRVYNFSDEKKQRLLNLLNVSGVDLTSNYDIKDILNQIKSDKKAGDNYVHFAVIEDVGSVKIVKLYYDEIENYLC